MKVLEIQASNCPAAKHNFGSLKRTICLNIVSKSRAVPLHVCWLMIVIIACTRVASQQSSVPLSTYSTAGIETGTVVVDLWDANNSMFINNISFVNPMSVAPQSAQIFYSLIGLEHDLTIGSDLEIELMFLVPPTTIEIGFTVKNYGGLNIHEATLGFFIIDRGTFPDQLYFQAVSFNFNSSYRTDSLALSFSPADVKVVPFLRKLQLISTPTNNLFQIDIEEPVVNDTHASVTVGFGSDGFGNIQYTSAQAGCKTLIVYLSQISSYNYQFLEPYDFNITTTGSPVLSDQILQYDPFTSLYIFGIRSFQLTSAPFSSLGIEFQISQQSGGFVSGNLSSHFTMAEVGIFGFNNVSCDIVTHLFYKKVNGKYQCFNECDSNEYYEMIQHNYGYAYECLSCPSNCQTCTSTSHCSSCWPEYELQSDASCQLKKGYYYNGTGGSVMQCNSTLGNECSDCTTDGSDCTECNPGFYLAASSTCVDCTTLVSHCSECDSTECHACLRSYILVSSTECQDPTANINNSSQNPVSPNNTNISIPCTTTDPNCSACSSADIRVCAACINAQHSVNSEGLCSPVCGDGKIDPNSQSCDDNNSHSFDGCSDQCQIQEGFACESWSIPSRCYFDDTITVTLRSINKVTDQNMLRIELSLSHPLISDWDHYFYNDLTELFTSSMQVDDGSDEQRYSYEAEFEFATTDLTEAQKQSISESHSREALQGCFGTIALKLSYYLSDQTNLSVATDPSLNHQRLNLNFDPSKSGLDVFQGDTSVMSAFSPNVMASNPLSQASVRTVASTSVSAVTFPLLTDNNQVVQVYSDAYYSLYQLVKVLAFLVSVVALAMFFGGILLSSLSTVFGNSEGHQPILKTDSKTLPPSKIKDPIQNGHQNVNSHQSNNLRRKMISNNLTLMAIEYGGVAQLTFLVLLAIGELNSLFVGLTEGLISVNLWGLSPLIGVSENLHRSLLGAGMHSDSFIDNAGILVATLLLVSVPGFILSIIQSYKYKPHDRPLSNEKNSPEVKQNTSHIQNTESVRVVDSSKSSEPQSNALQAATSILLGHIGLPLLIFCSYAVFTSIGIQLFWAESLGIESIIVMVLALGLYAGYGCLILLRPEVVLCFLTKITCENEDQMPTYQQPLESNHQNRSRFLSDQLTESGKNQRSNRNRKFYVLFTLVERIINSLCIPALLSFQAQPAIPILSYGCFLIGSCRLRMITKAQQFRFYGTLVVGLIVQGMLLVRKIQTFEYLSDSYAGAEQVSIGQYIPLSIALLLLVLGLVTLAHFIYAIRWLRCFELELQWKRAVTPHTEHLPAQGKHNGQPQQSSPKVTASNQLNSTPVDRPLEERRSGSITGDIQNNNKSNKRPPEVIFEEESEESEQFSQGEHTVIQRLRPIPKGSTKIENSQEVKKLVKKCVAEQRLKKDSTGSNRTVSFLNTCIFQKLDQKPMQEDKETVKSANRKASIASTNCNSPRKICEKRKKDICFNIQLPPQLSLEEQFNQI